MASRDALLPSGGSHAPSSTSPRGGHNASETAGAADVPPPAESLSPYSRRLTKTRVAEKAALRCTDCDRATRGKQWLLMMAVTVVLAALLAALLLLTTGPHTAHDSRPRVLFVWRDAGETMALLPVFHAMRATYGEAATGGARNTTAGMCSMRGGCGDMFVEALVTGSGTAPPAVTQDEGVISLASLGVAGTANLGNRSAVLLDHDVQRVLRHFDADVIVTGLVSAVQLQFAAAARDRSTAGANASSAATATATATMVVGYDDGFGLAFNGASWPAKALERQVLDRLWTTARSIAAAASTFAHGAGVKAVPNITAVGSPTLAEWQGEVDAFGAASLAGLRQQVVGHSPATPLVHFFGGYDTPGSTKHPYMDAVRVFAQGVAFEQRKKAPAVAGVAPPPLVATFSAHPGNFTTSAEEAVFRAEGADVMVVTNVPSALLAAMANVTASHDSTCGIQSLFVGTPHIFVGAPHWANVASAVVPTADTAAAFEQEFTTLKAAGFRFDEGKLAAAGIPLHSASEIEALLRTAVGV